MITATEAKEAFERLSFSLNASDDDIKLVHGFLRHQVVRDDRENTPHSYLNREEEVVQRLNRKLSGE